MDPGGVTAMDVHVGMFAFRRYLPAALLYMGTTFTVEALDPWSNTCVRFKKIFSVQYYLGIAGYIIFPV